MNKKLLLPAFAAAATLVLVGCSTDAQTGDGLFIDVPDVPMLEELGEAEGSVDIVAWSGFVEPEWADTFTEETGCVVNRRVAGTSDEMVTLMRTGEYDLVSASGDASLRLIAGGDVAPINLDLIPNFGDDIVEGMKGQVYDTINGNSYGVPIGRGANILQYNSEVIPEAPESWDVVWEADSPYAGQIIAYDAPIYIADAAVYLMATQPELGITNPYALDQTQLDAAIALLQQQNDIVSEYWADPVAQITSFAGGTTVVGTSWEILRKLTGDDKFQGTLPVEGSTGWSDAWMISSESDSPNCAYLWMDYTSAPDVNGAIAMNFGMAPANAAFCETSDEAAAHCEEFNATNEDYFDQVWYWTTPIEQCVDGRTDVQCTNFQQWTQAWLTVKG
ncbi:ABC transporter substrate-binding protein [Chryseoglobus sp. 28M-23]|uniref:ABC transporter substrate-binding protein n=1 Tax=Chryseoglobus sp. 28M-23 TaxID=2772253 RepID=UPI0017469D58|nr:ABC transporter substrate-binding protein [Chryseoglobus sp. 28M-23]MBU1250317.1 ABC transporter substrate-binding protein [Actinomycetota bacterium]MBU1609993.1 ABC transporter substrate-binding protein [Actinomycetota bacterium]MBU2315639.1 ABC transporter substrate-binding protein [Actinomycetota bacterium]MBU2385493.1 ABC transporter substrate-binding protein [Actinomycetota bacterium]QOD94042.1 ABC transporter substrate-binding protein [Chryseoglobus sp. 28M-23]